MTVRDTVHDLLNGPDALHLAVSFESLVAGLIAPLLGAGLDPEGVRCALRRVADSDEIWKVMIATVEIGEGVAADAANAIDAERSEVLS